MMLTSSNVTMTTSTHHLQKNPVTISKTKTEDTKALYSTGIQYFAFNIWVKLILSLIYIHTYIHVGTKTDTHLYTDTEQKTA